MEVKILYMEVSITRGSPKWMVFEGNPIKWMICVYPYSRKPPHVSMSTESTCHPELLQDLLSNLDVDCLQNPSILRLQKGKKTEEKLSTSDV